jgi:hypothetical protein
MRTIYDYYQFINNDFLCLNITIYLKQNCYCCCCEFSIYILLQDQLHSLIVAVVVKSDIRTNIYACVCLFLFHSIQFNSIHWKLYKNQLNYD